MLIKGALALVVLTLVGCTNAAPIVDGHVADLTLRATKSQVQLLRNDVAARLEPGAVRSVEETVDESVSCLDPEADPSETIRAWRSSALVTIVENGQTVDAIFDVLVDSFHDQGWSSISLGDSKNFRSVRLTSESSLAEITLVREVPRDYETETSHADQLDAPTIAIEVHGPCVRTAGADSDEVAQLNAP